MEVDKTVYQVYFFEIASYMKESCKSSYQLTEHGDEDDATTNGPDWADALARPDPDDRRLEHGRPGAANVAGSANS